ncbi:TadE/TadG family type IV pilus assembly protein [Frigidibacter sp. ROC022]|uniref:TadE/TadG family type IV pilus assembly protein n=1 Tax=Frigidibacter sp. ROC022 TaxID=2971796 RepID=UPI00215A30FA|nr:hypothetical protein [Frigidibacter sp. ROC022]MCR8723676.1 hypothetical protein [Frigidibacter sp. ROC022]
MKHLRARLARFGRDGRGSLSIEAALMIPLITWIMVTTFTYFDTFRADSTNVKAAYTVGDMLSRETEPVDATYIEGLNTMFSYMVFAQEGTWIRVSNVGFDSSENKMVLNWTYATGSHTAATMAELEPQIPMMSDGDTVIVVETFMPFTPAFNIGLDRMTFRNVVVTRPRFAPQLLWAS